jgi:hypothetical protein
MLFFVKVRIDVGNMVELGQKLQSGELDTSNMKDTYCIADDPAVGMTIWEVQDKEEFEAKFEPFKVYYADVLEITPVIPAAQAQQVLLEQLAG